MTINALNYQKKNLSRFKKQLDYLYDNNKYYREKIIENDIDLSSIKKITDITKLPLLTKQDLFHDYPYGFYSTKRKNIARYHATSGTTGKPLIVGFTKKDLKTRNKMVLDICKRAGIKKDDVVQICVGYGMFTGAFSFHDALEQYGCTIIPTSSGNTEKQIFYMKMLHTTVLITSPSYAMHLYEVAKEMGIDVKELDLRILKVGSELLTEEMRKRLQEAYGDKVIINQDYGMTETMGPGLGSECKYCDGLHLYTKNFVYELVDPVTKMPTDKNVGELVISTLHNECLPLIRYATNDIVELDYTKCKCGSRAPRIKKVIGRCDDMIKCKGVKLFLSQVEDFILKHHFCTSNYEIILTTEKYIDKIKIEIESIYDFAKMDEKMKKKIEEQEKRLVEEFKSTFGIYAKVMLVAPNSIKRQNGKVKRIKDLRKL